MSHDVAVLAIVLLLLGSCEVSVKRERLFTVATAAPAAAAIAGVEEAPQLRLLEDYNGRLRLLAQDPFTRRYRVVR